MFGLFYPVFHVRVTLTSDVFKNMSGPDISVFERAACRGDPAIALRLLGQTSL